MTFDTEKSEFTALVLRVLSAPPPRNGRQWLGACKAIFDTQLKVVDARTKLRSLDAECKAGRSDAAKAEALSVELDGAMLRHQCAVADAMSAIGSNDAEKDAMRQLWADEYMRMRASHLSIQSIETSPATR